MTHHKFTWPVRVYWEDTDAGGIVFYANYLKFFERARTEWLRARGIEQHALREHTGGMFVVSEAALRYHRPSRLDDMLTISTWPLEIGRASMTLRQEAWLTTAGEPSLLCDATIRIGWVDAHTHKPARIPATLLETLK